MLTLLGVLQGGVKSFLVFHRGQLHRRSRDLETWRLSSLTYPVPVAKQLLWGREAVECNIS